MSEEDGENLMIAVIIICVCFLACLAGWAFADALIEVAETWAR